PIYVAFQEDAELTPDGFPGRNTMAALQTVLTTMGVSMPNVPIYTWSASGGYDGVNAPTSTQWYGSSAVTPPSPPPPPSTRTTSTTTNNASFLSSLANLSSGTKLGLLAVAVLAVGYVAIEAGRHPIGHAPARARRSMQHHARRLTRRPSRRRRHR